MLHIHFWPSYLSRPMPGWSVILNEEPKGLSEEKEIIEKYLGQVQLNSDDFFEGLLHGGLGR